MGIDAYSWLHRGIYTCASEICRGKDTSKYVDYCMHRVRMLIHYNVTPVLVFDGAALPMKAATHRERRERREDALRKAEQAIASGNSRLAEEHFQRACSVTPEMARKLIRACRRINVEYVVAPYEADAQLAWMMRSGYVDGVITEDSDLLVYGASKVLYKMNRTGEGDMYEMKNLGSLQSVNMFNFTEEMFVCMCVASGCDFFKGISGVGLKKSHGLVKRFRTMSRFVHAIRMDGRYKVSKTFAEDFTKACMVFRHQTVYDMSAKQTVPLRKFDEAARARLPPGALKLTEDGSLDLTFLGDHRESDVAVRIAQGLIHPGTFKEYEEPLDAVERPMARSANKRLRRPFTFPDPAPRPARRAIKTSRDAGGFKVFPASGGSNTQIAQSGSQQQRLSISSRSFNPRKVAANFNSINSSPTTLTPRFSRASSASIDKYFQSTPKEANPVGESNSYTEHDKECGKDLDQEKADENLHNNNQEEEEIERSTEREEEVAQSIEQTMEEGLEILQHKRREGGEDAEVEEQTAKRRRIERAISRFACPPKDLNAKYKFMPSMRHGHKSNGPATQKERNKKQHVESVKSNDGSPVAKVRTSKFKPVTRPVAANNSQTLPDEDGVRISQVPCSPDRDAYELFDQIDAELSGHAEDMMKGKARGIEETIDNVKMKRANAALKQKKARGKKLRQRKLALTPSQGVHSAFRNQATHGRRLTPPGGLSAPRSSEICLRLGTSGRKLSSGRLKHGAAGKRQNQE